MTWKTITMKDYGRTITSLPTGNEYMFDVVITDGTNYRFASFTLLYEFTTEYRPYVIGYYNTYALVTINGGSVKLSDAILNSTDVTSSSSVFAYYR